MTISIFLSITSFPSSSFGFHFSIGVGRRFFCNSSFRAFLARATFLSAFFCLFSLACANFSFAFLSSWYKLLIVADKSNSLINSSNEIFLSLLFKLFTIVLLLSEFFSLLFLSSIFSGFKLLITSFASLSVCWLLSTILSVLSSIMFEISCLTIIPIQNNGSFLSRLRASCHVFCQWSACYPPCSKCQTFR